VSVDSYQREIQRYQQELARLQQDKSREVTQTADANRKANAAASAAAKSSNISTLNSKIRESERYQSDAARHQQKVAQLESKIADIQRRLFDASKRLDNAQQQVDRRNAQLQKQAQQKHEREVSHIVHKLSQHDEMHSLALSAIHKLQQLPSEITVLFLAANPIDQQQLRLDEEVRSISEMIRKSKHRDAVKLESRWAVRPLDVLQAINECQPTIVHFSGHGSDQDEIVFQDSSGNTKMVSKEAIVQTMAAASGDIQLVFFNTCYSRGQAEAIVKYIPAAIGMNTSIGDEAARIFSAQFYSSIGFGLSIKKSFDQAIAALLLEKIPEDSTPELLAAAGLDLNEIRLLNI
jgi:hypothetical protein